MPPRCGIDIPVVADLVFEDSRSPLIAAITALRVLLFTYAYGLLASSGLFAPGLTCPEALGAPQPATEAAAVALFLVFTGLAALAASRAQSRRLVPPALAAGVAHLALLSAVELPACDALVRGGGTAAGSGSDGSRAVAAVALNAVDAALSIATLGCLAMIFAEDPPAALGRGPPQETEARASRGLVNVAALRDNAASGAGPSSATSWAGRTILGLRVAPLRHNLAALLAASFIISATVVAGTTSALVRQYEPVLSSLLSPFFAHAISDTLLSVFVGALLSCAFALVSIAASYAPIADDLAASAAAPAMPSAAENAPGVSVGAEDFRSAATPAAEPAATAASPLAMPLFGGAAAAASGGGTAAAVISFLMQSPGTPFKDDGALDFEGEFFSIAGASAYTALYIMNQLTVFFLATAVFAAIVFVMTSRVTIELSTQLAIAFAVSWLYQRAAAWAFSRWVARGSTVLRPRLLVAVDFVLACSLGAAQGFTAGLTRFLLGVLVVMVRTATVSRPLVPAPFAGLDAGFVAYGCMLKAAMTRLPPEESAPAQAPAPTLTPTPAPAPAAPEHSAAPAPGNAAACDDAAGSTPVAAAHVAVVVAHDPRAALCWCTACEARRRGAPAGELVAVAV